tara:strand:+ start:774 stop:1358 length:585 start_codon:yes stop_codon:yes gene_type:complete
MEEYNQEAVDAFAKAGRPIPGQSLTSNPDEPKPFEGPTDFTNFKEALDYTAAELLLEENFMPIVLAMGDGIPVTDLAMQIGYVGFREGKWNPDLMMMLMEPIMYLLMALAEKAGIKYRIDDEDDDDEDSTLNQSNQFEQLKKVTKERFPTKSSVSKTALPKDILEKVEELEIPKESLLLKPTEEKPKSLLAQGQ